MTYDLIDKGIIALLQGDLPLESHPFKSLAEQMGIREADIIERIEELQIKGAIRRWGAVLRHHQAGYRFNAMVAWKVEKANIDETGRNVSECPQISHCYLRQVPNEFPYELFTMIHARSEAELLSIIEKTARDNSLRDYIIIKSLREFKKASMKYV